MEKETKIVDDKVYYFRYSATLRISGEINSLEQISNTLGLEPTHVHKKGEISVLSSPYEFDMWQYTVPVAKKQPLDIHLKTLWAYLKPHKNYLMNLKKSLKLDIFCGYQSNSSTAGFEISYKSLEIFSSLQIPFEVSVIVSSNELHRALGSVSEE